MSSAERGVLQSRLQVSHSRRCVRLCSEIPDFTVRRVVKLEILWQLHVVLKSAVGLHFINCGKKHICKNIFISIAHYCIIKAAQVKLKILAAGAFGTWEMWKAA